MLMLQVVAAVAAVLVIAIVLWDVFETVVLPRRVSRRVRLARAYFRSTWRISAALIGPVPGLERREAALAVYGPIAILGLLVFWVLLLLAAYGLLLWGLGSPLTASHGATSIGTDLYYSGTTLLTLGLGDVIPRTGPARFVTVVEVATGFGMLALVIGYLPILYQAFSRREVLISLLDAHAGSPPTAGTLLLRHPPNRRARRLTSLLASWEGWAAELLETHLSYPVLAYYRSQHENQSWVAALGMILDASALVLVCERGLGGDDELAEQAAFTFAIARHTAVDLAQVFHQRRAKVADTDKRLPPAERARLRHILTAVEAAASRGGMSAEGNVVGRLDRLRALYEPYLEALAEFLLMPLPPWVPEPGVLDDWQTTADEVIAPSIAELESHHPLER
jgi:hypothetical protein